MSGTSLRPWSGDRRRCRHRYAVHHIHAIRSETPMLSFYAIQEGTPPNVYILMCAGFLVQFCAHRCIFDLSSAKENLFQRVTPFAHAEICHAFHYKI